MMDGYAAFSDSYTRFYQGRLDAFMNREIEANARVVREETDFFTWKPARPGFFRGYFPSLPTHPVVFKSET